MQNILSAGEKKQSSYESMDVHRGLDSRQPSMVSNFKKNLKAQLNQAQSQTGWHWKNKNVGKRQKSSYRKKESKSGRNVELVSGNLMLACNTIS